MRRKWIVGLVALAAAVGTATMATSVFGGGSEPRTGYNVVEVKMKSAPNPASQRAQKAKKQKKPRMVYLQGPSQLVDVAQTGPYIDVRLSSCPGNSRVIEGGVVADNVGVFEQGSYVESRKTYHVLIGFDPQSAAVNFNLGSHLTCIKGVKGG
jgi:hypothetical protein